MINISLAGIGGQGSVLAARILAEAASAKGWQVRTAETTGMAQRGGSVMSHIRMGNLGEEVFSPLPAHLSDEVIIALEPGEALRALPYLKPGGLVVTARSGVAPVLSTFKASVYDPANMLKALCDKGILLEIVDDVVICDALGSRKVLNIVMLAAMLHAVAVRKDCEHNALRGALSLDDMRKAVSACVKPQFIDLNMRAIDAVEKRMVKQ